jgi:hypothetical protein
MEPDSTGSKLGIATVLVGNIAHGWSDAIEEDDGRAEALLMEVLQAGTDIAGIHAINGTLRRSQGRLDASLGRAGDDDGPGAALCQGSESARYNTHLYGEAGGSAPSLGEVFGLALMILRRYFS